MLGATDGERLELAIRKAMARGLVRTTVLGAPNWIVGAEDGALLVETERSRAKSGSPQPIPIQWIEEAYAQLLAGGVLIADHLPRPVRHRSSFVLAMLATVDGVVEDGSGIKLIGSRDEVEVRSTRVLGRFLPGSTVRSVGTDKTGVVVADFGSSVTVLFYGDGSPSEVSSSDIEQLEESTPLRPEEFVASLTAYKISSGLSNVLYGYLSSRTIFREYQFLPALRFLESDSRRLLIADEVGLGKTIEAGLICLELMARGQGDRLLFVVPPHLRTKWRTELQHRFDITAEMWDGKDLDYELDEIASKPSLAGRPMRAIISHHAMAGPSRASRWDESDTRPSRAELMANLGVGWDLIVVDEAHHGRNTGTRRNQSFADLSRATDALLFLTATPLNLGNHDLFNLLQLLRPDRFQSLAAFQELIAPSAHITSASRALRQRDPGLLVRAIDRLTSGDLGPRLRESVELRTVNTLLKEDERLENATTVSAIDREIKRLHPLAGIFTRTRKRDLPEPFARREARRMKVEWRPEEWEFYDALLEHIDGFRSNSAFARIMPARQAASCIPAMLERIDEQAWIRPETWGDDLAESGEAVTATDDSLGLGTDRLAEAVRRVRGVDTKYDRFQETLTAVLEGDADQILVFSFFKKTLAYLERRLSAAGFSIGMISGDIPMDDRLDLISRFRRGQFQILLSSEVGSEGLDFEFVGCMVNYDLPWNPMVVEQRIGRLDRFGQEHEKILVLNFHIPGTIETDIVERLFDRIGIFERAVGDLDDIVGSEIEEALFHRLTTLRLDAAERAQIEQEIEVAIAKRRQITEELDSHRDLLAASGELLAEQFESLRGGGRYLDPAEIEKLTLAGVQTLIRGVKTERLDETSWRIIIPYREAMRSPLSTTFSTLGAVANRIAFGAPLEVTFDYQTASRNRRLTFLTGRHPLVQAIARHTIRARPLVRTIGSVAVGPLDGVTDGVFEVRLYELEAHSLNERKELVCAAVDRATGDRAPLLERHILGILARTVPAPGDDHALLNDFTLREIGANIREQVTSAEAARFELDIARRREVAEAIHTAKIKALQALVFKTSGTSVEAANRGRLMKAEERLQRQLTDLNHADAPAVHLRPLSDLIVTVSHLRLDAQQVYSIPTTSHSTAAALDTPASAHHAETATKWVRNKSGKREFTCTRCFQRKRPALLAPGLADVCVDCS